MIQKSIIKNTSILMGSQLTTWTLSFLLTIFMPRYLGAETVGKLHFANSIWAILAVVCTFGMDTLLVKEVARFPNSALNLFLNSVLIRFVLFGAIYAALFFLFQGLDYPTDTKIIVYLVGISYAFSIIIGASAATFQGLEKMGVFSIGHVIQRTLDTFLGIALLLLGYGIYGLVILFTMSGAINLALQLKALNRIERLTFRINLPEYVRMLSSGVPYLMSNVFLVVYMQIDIVIISALVSERAVGLYGVADRLFGTLLFIPTVFITAMFPVFSRLFEDTSDSLNKLMRHSFDTLIMLSIPIGLGLVMIADPLVVLLYGADFAQSGPILAIMGIVLILTYQNMLLGRFLISMDRQTAWTIVMMVATLATVPLDYVLVPWSEGMFNNGAMGGAIAFVVTESAMMIVGLWLLPKGTLNRSNAWTAARVIVAGVVMMYGVSWLQEQFILIPILCGAVIYLGLIWAMGVVPKEDWNLIVEFTQRFLYRFNRNRVETVSG
ncbi:MAG: flippase [Caldilineaceae bacterium]